MDDTPPFQPPVTVSALALQNLTQLPFLRFHLAHPASLPAPSPQNAPPPPPVPDRAKWLEYGVGRETAYAATAVALLAESVPAALPTVVYNSHPVKHPISHKNEPTANPPSRVEQDHPQHSLSLWVFATSDVLQTASDLITATFVTAEEGVWTPHAPISQTNALLAALKRAFTLALEAEGALRVSDHILHPQRALSYSFRLSLATAKLPHILIRVAVSHIKVRHLDDDDTAILLNSPDHLQIPVFTSPLGLKATLAKRSLAGDALTASVLKRWREAGLLPFGQLTDSAVVFLRLEDGTIAPFPRVCILTTEGKDFTTAIKKSQKQSLAHVSASNSSKSINSSSKKSSKSGTGLWRSRKRPRSPSAIIEETEGNLALDLKDSLRQPQFPSIPDQAQPAKSPTAYSFNAAIVAEVKKGVVDPVPTLYHPLVDPVPLPSVQTTEDKHPTSSTRASTNISNPEEARTGLGPRVKTPTARDQAATEKQLETVPQPPSKSQSNIIKTEPVPKTSQSANGMDAFNLDSTASNPTDTCTGFDAGPSMDMNDFSAFDDDVTQFFGGGMDDRLMGVDNPLPTSDEAARSTRAALSESHGRTGDQDSDAAQSEGDVNKQPRVVKMEVDSEMDKVQSDSASKLVSSRGGTDDSCPDAKDVVGLALSALRKPVPSARPTRDYVNSQLKSFFEEDLTKRRSVRLNVTGRIAKSNGRTKYIRKPSVSRIATDIFSVPLTSMRSSRSVATHESHSSYDPNSVPSNLDSQNLRSLFVPERKLKTFFNLSRKGIQVKAPLILSQNVSVPEHESDESDEEPDTNRTTYGAGLIGNFDTLLKDALSKKAEEGRAPGSELDSRDMRSQDSSGKDASKVVQSVAVDCASACLMLATSRAMQHSAARLLSEGSSSLTADANNSTLTSKDEDMKGFAQGQPTAGRQGFQGPAAASKTTQSPSQQGIAGARATSKREREILALLSLFEMQVFSVQDLELFKEVQDPKLLNDAKNASSDCPPFMGAGCERVSSATMRRVLLGLPRVLETSHVLGNCSASLREQDGDGLSIKIQGPLGVCDILGANTEVFPLKAPRVCVGYNKEWMETSSGILPLWEKAGLEPYSDRKNVEYVAVAPKDMENDVRLFLRDVSAAYEECCFGRHVPMPFDAVTLISNSISQGNEGLTANGESLSEYDKAMAEQYHLAVTGLCTKLAAVTRDQRKNPSGSATNIVAYIISPFLKHQTAANVALLKAIAPLVGAVPGTAPSMVSSTSSANALPSAPWRASPASKSVASITVRIIPREGVSRQLSGHAEIDGLLDRPLRPQLMKAVSFAVFSSIRSKRVRTPNLDGEVAGLLPRTALMPDDLMSPMTPDIVAESPGGSTATPVSPMGNSADDSAGSSLSLGSHNGVLLDLSSALAPSYLHEPAVVLAGVGQHMGQTGDRSNLVLHLSYACCEASSRYVFAWTDQRGEMLDIATVPVSKLGLGASRRRAFWCMWARGQRWRISYVAEVHATISKLGVMDSGEVEDWDWVIGKVLCECNTSDKRSDGQRSRNTIRRFPPVQHGRSDDLSDSYTDQPTPATPGVPHVGAANGSTKSTPTMDIKAPAICSLSLLSVCDCDTHLLMERSGDVVDSDRQDFAIVSKTSLSEGKGVEASAILARFEEEGVKAIELNMMRHYGDSGQSEEMTDDRPVWDAFDVQTIVNTIATNFHGLRHIVTPPSWPYKSWLSIYPLHIDVVRNFKLQMQSVQRFAYGSATAALR